jgi:hypothetical protein
MAGTIRLGVNPHRAMREFKQNLTGLSRAFYAAEG